MTKKKQKIEFRTTRTSRGLRDCLFEELDLLRNGKSEPQRAASVAKLAVQIINTAMIEVHLCRTDLSLGDSAIKVRPIQLGSVG